MEQGLYISGNAYKSDEDQSKTGKGRRQDQVGKVG